MADRSADFAGKLCRMNVRSLSSPTNVWWATGRGVPGGIRCPKTAVVARRFPTMFGSAEQILKYDVSGARSGTVKIGASVVPFAHVVLFHRETYRPLAEAICDAAGAFAFSNLYKTPEAYFAVAFHPDGTSNAVIFDKLTPT